MNISKNIGSTINPEIERRLQNFPVNVRKLALKALHLAKKHSQQSSIEILSQVVKKITEGDV